MALTIFLATIGLETFDASEYSSLCKETISLNRLLPFSKLNYMI